MPKRRVQNDWQFQDAKTKFSEVFPLAREPQPQLVTRHDGEAVVVISAEEYERLSKPKTRKGSLVGFFSDSPLAGSGIRLDRHPDCDREIDL